jgi:hypothetical protein
MARNKGRGSAKAGSQNTGSKIKGLQNKDSQHNKTASVSQLKVTTEKVTAENKCDLCTGSICCTYITHQLDKPKKMKDFDYLLWQVSHEKISVFKDDDGWFLSVSEPCGHLQEGGRCGIYAVRPDICRDHTNDGCEFDGPAEDDFDLYFDTYEKLDVYCRDKFKNWDRRFEKWAASKDKKKDKKEAAA